jgi:hypothetical protein
LKSKAYKGLVFIVVLLGALFVLEKIFDFGFRHNLNLKAAYVSGNRVDADLLVLGPCEPLWMVSPAFLAKHTGLSSYNLAGSHSDFADNYLHLLLYLQHNEPPRYLLLYVTPESFDTRYNTFHSYRFAPFFSNEKVRRTVLESDRPYAVCGHIPFIKYGYYAHRACFIAFQGWKHYLTGKQEPYFPDGFEPPARVAWDNHHENLKKMYPKGYSFTWDSARENYLHAILNECASRKVKVILYESPILKEIADYQQNRGLCMERIRNIARMHDCPYLVFDEVPWARDRKYFISPMVSTLEGSYLFSDTLGRLLKEKYVK